MPTRYCTPEDVQTYLGQSLTSEQLITADSLTVRASAWIDRYTGRAWTSTAVADEWHQVYGTDVFLRQTPIASVTSVRTAAAGGGTTVTYVLRNTATGWLHLRSWVREVYVIYVPAAVPADVVQAAVLLTAHWLQPDRLGLKGYSVGGELTVTLQEEGIPAEVRALLATRRGMALA